MRADAAKAALALEQLQEVRSDRSANACLHTVSVVCWQQASVLARDQTGQDQTIGRFAGVYKYDSTYDGWPVLKSASGNFCYRHTKSSTWRIGDEHNHDIDRCYLYIAAPDGPLPVGAHTWKLLSRNGWQDDKMMVSLMVR